MLDGFVRKIKKIILRNKKNTSLNFIKLQEVENPYKIGILKFFKFIANLAFFPFAALTFWEFKKRGFHLYFSAEYKGGETK